MHKYVGFFRFGLPVGPVGLGDFDSAAAGWTAAEVATTDTAGFHLAQVMADGRAAFFQMARQFGLSGFQDGLVPPGIQAEIDKQLEGSVGKEGECFFHFGPSRKPSLRILQDERDRAHVSSSRF